MTGDMFRKSAGYRWSPTGTFATSPISTASARISGTRCSTVLVGDTSAAADIDLQPGMSDRQLDGKARNRGRSRSALVLPLNPS